MARWKSVVPSREDQYLVKRREVIRQAGLLFSRLGYHNTSMDEVARSLNVTKPALYYYVSDKEEALFECFNLALDIGEEALVKAESEVPGIKQISAFITSYVELNNQSLNGFTIVSEPMTSLSSAHQEQILERKRDFDLRLRKIIELASDKEELCNEPSAFISGFVMGAITYIKRWYEPGGEKTSEEVARIFSDLILHGISLKKARRDKKPGG